MSVKQEQIDRHDRNVNARRFVKKTTSRKRRRVGDKLLDDAPKKPTYRGYTR